MKNNPLINSQGALSIVYITVQQLIVALSTFFIIKSVVYINNENYYFGSLYIIGFVFCLFIVLIPVSLSEIQSQKWYYESIRKYIDYFSKHNFGKSFDSQRGCRKAKEPWISSQGPVIIREATSDFTFFLSMVLNSFFSVLVLGFMMNISILISFIIATLAVISIGFSSSKFMAVNSKEMQAKENKFSGILLTAWENILIGNRVNFQSWNKEYKTTIKNAETSFIKYEVYRSLISGLATGICIFTVVLGNVYYIKSESDLGKALSILTVSLPRQVQIIQSLYGSFKVLLGLKSCLDRLNLMIKDTIVIRDTTSVLSLIKLSDLYFTWESKSIQFSSYKELYNFIQSCPSGRLCINGENGSGKSVLLSTIAEKFTNSFLLPANFYSLHFDSVDFHQESSGQKIISIFESIKKDHKVGILLLDEWDANLDYKNFSNIDKYINKISLKKLVIEVRHFKEKLS